MRAPFDANLLSKVHRRGVANSRAVAALMDGAEWLQGFVDYHCPQAVRMLDFPHAGQRLGQVAQALWGEATAETQQWTYTQLHALKHQGSDEVLNTLRQLQQQPPDLNLLQENLAYVEKNPRTGGLSHLSAARLADWEWDRRKRQQTRRRSPAQRGRNALETRKCGLSLGGTQPHL